MKSKKTISLLVLMLVVMASFVSPLYSQSGPRSVSIRLQQPPPNQLNISSLWRATLTNNTKEPIKIYLEGYAEEEKSGRIVEGKTDVFILPLGKKDYKYEDFKSGSVNWINKKYEEPIIRTGTAPTGTYTICMTAKNEQGEIVGMEQCITQIVDIKTEGEITLISPADREQIKDTKGGITFVWSPPMPAPSGKLVYAIKIVEIIGNQSPEEAIRKNSPFFENKDITSTQYQYSPANQKLQPGKKYGWQVTMGDISSQVFLFLLEVEQNYKITIDSIKCITIQNSSNWFYRIKIKVTNNHPSQDLKITGVNFYQPDGSSCPSGAVTAPLGQSRISITPSIPYSSIPHFSSGQPGVQDFILIADKGTTNDAYFNIQFLHEYIGGGGGYDCDSIKIPPCSCCEGFVRKIDSLNVSDTSGITSINAILTAGPKPIIKVTAEMVYFSYIPDGINGNPDYPCRRCVWGSEQFGNFGFASNLAGMPGVLTTNPTLPYTYSREVIWQSPTAGGVNMSAGSPVTLSLLLPPKNSLFACCQDTIKLCVRLSFTDTSCVTCDTVICGQFVRRGTDIGMGYIDKLFDNIYKTKIEAGGYKKIENNNVIPESPFEINTKKPNNIMQGPGDWWYFGNGAGIHFNPNPTFVSDGQTSHWEGVASMSDASTGNLLFYTNGVSVWNRNHNVMPNGNNLLGDFSSVQSAIIVPKPGSSTNYFIFTVDEVGGPNGLCYSEVDMNANSGLGDVLSTNKNTQLITPVSEMVTAVCHNDPSQGYWIITHKCPSTDEFYVYRVTSSGVNLTPSIQNVGTSNISTGRGLRVSQQNNKLAMGTLHNVQVYDFDNSSGLITNPTDCKLPAAPNGDSLAPYGIEFSPNGRFLYVSTYRSKGLFQFDLLNNNNRVNIKDPENLNASSDFGALQLGPDGKIYLAHDQVNGNGPNGLGVIDLPDNLGLGCGFDNLGLPYPSGYTKKCGLGLPNFVPCIIGNPDPLPPSTCCDSVTTNVQTQTNNNDEVQVINNRYYIKNALMTSPHNITQVRANLVNFYINNLKDCERCVTSNINFGSIIPVPPPGLPGGWNSQINWNGTMISPSLTKPPSAPFNSTSNFRELVWSLNGISRPPIGGEKLIFELKFPQRLQLTCCPDTINFCIRWSFTDITCQTCDTLICYKYVRPGGTGQIIQQQIQQEFEKEDIEMQKNLEEDMRNTQKIKDELKGKKIGLIKHTETENQYTNMQNQSAGIINFNVTRSTKVRLTLYDVNGKELFKVYDSDLGEGKYSVDLSAYSIPDGVYYYKIKNGETIENKKVLVINQLSSCNCGKK